MFDGISTPCQVCESTKTKIIFDELSTKKYENSLICMAHTAEDIAGYLSEIFYIGSNYSDWKEMQNNNPVLFSRLIELAKRVYPKYQPNSFKFDITYIKPLIELDEDTIRKVKTEQNYPDIPECCAEIKGNHFQMYKRIVMKCIDWLNNRYKDNQEIHNNLLFKNYRKMLKKYKDIGLIPDITEIEKMNLKSGI